MSDQPKRGVTVSGVPVPAELKGGVTQNVQVPAELKRGSTQPNVQVPAELKRGSTQTNIQVPAEARRPASQSGVISPAAVAQARAGGITSSSSTTQSGLQRTGLLDPTVAPTGAEASPNAKAQALARNLVSGLYMLVRSVKLYDPDNAIFQKPLQVLLDTANAIIARDGKCELAVAEGSFYVNGQAVRVEANALDSLKYLAGEMEARQVGGFGLQRPTNSQELKNFISIFARDQNQSAGEDGLDGKKLVSMRLTKWQKIKEKLNADADGQVDRKKYAMTVYARAVFFVQDAIKGYLADKPLPVEPALRLVQEIVDLTRTQRTQFLGMTCNGDGDQALPHHLVNSALLAVAFGGELGLARPQLRELGYAALFADLPLAKLPVQLRFQLQPETLPKEIAVTLIEARRAGIRAVLATGAPSRAQKLLATVMSEIAVPFGKPTRDSRGRITFVVPQGDPLSFSRICAIAGYYDLLTSSVPGREAYGPEIALDVMWNQQRYRFDPELLSIFMKVMAQQPIKIMEKTKSTVALG